MWCEGQFTQLNRIFVDGKHAIAGCRPRHYLWRLDYRVNLLALGQHSFLHGGRLPRELDIIRKLNLVCSAKLSVWADS